MTENTFMLLAASIIGVLGGLGAVVFRKLIEGVEFISQQFMAIMFSPWSLGILFVVAISLCRFLSRRYAPEAMGHGVPEIIEAVTVRGGHIRARVGFVKTLLSALTIGVGGSCGAEGPIALIGASVGSKFGQWMKVNSQRLKIFAACGAAAGIAATFNAPLGGFMFAIEIVLMDFGLTKVAPIVVSTILASATANHWFHGHSTLALSAHEMTHDFWILGCLFLGLGIGLASTIYILVLDRCEQFFRSRLIARLGYGSAFLAGLCFLVLVGTFEPVKGVGNSFLESLFSGQLQVSWQWLVLLMLAKILATGITLGSGGSGGIFFPGLFVGAVGGLAIGQLLQMALPGLFHDNDPIIYGILGMGGMVSGAMRAPMTGILITYELNRAANYDLILPLMLVCVISTVVSRQFFPHSIFTLRLARKGTLVSKGRDVEISRTVKVADCLDAHYYMVTADMTLQALFRLSQTVHSHTHFFVCDGVNLLGVIPIHRVRQHYAKVQDMASEITAANIMVSAPALLKPEDTLEHALRLFEKWRLDELPVVANGEMKGVLTSTKALNAYNQALQRLHVAQQIGDTIAFSEERELIDLGDGISLVEIPTPQPFVGKMVKELELPRYHKVHLLMLKSAHNKKVQVIHAETCLQNNQTLVLMGPTEDVKKISRL